jgi:hypothetical protein
MLCVVASFPDPSMLETEERQKWEALTTAAIVERFGSLLRSGICHGDSEGFYHIHYLVWYDDARPIRHLCAGHAAADAEPIKSLKGERFRESSKEVLDWYFERIGKPLGWLRMSPTPRPHGRVSRSQAQRNRQHQLETEAAALQKRNAELEKKAQELAVALAQHHENVTHFDADFSEGEEYFARRREEIDAEAEILRRERETVQSIKVEYESRKLRIEAEAAAQWRVIGEAVEKTKAWQEEVRDQVALEARVAKIRVKVRPGSAAFGAADQDDDLSDIPF